jgi:hypothetical protein
MARRWLALALVFNTCAASASNVTLVQGAWGFYTGEAKPCGGIDAGLTNWMLGGLRTIFYGRRFVMFADDFSGQQPSASGCRPVYPYFCADLVCGRISSVDAAFFLPVAGVDVLAEINSAGIPGKIFLLSGNGVWRFTAVPTGSNAIAALDEGFPQPLLTTGGGDGGGVFAGASLSPGDLDDLGAATWIPFDASAPANTTDRGLLFKGKVGWEFMRGANTSAPFTVNPGVPVDSIIKPPINALCTRDSLPAGQDPILVGITHSITYQSVPRTFFMYKGTRPMPYLHRYINYARAPSAGTAVCKPADATGGPRVVMCVFIIAFVLACYVMLWTGRVKAPLAGCSLLQLPATLCSAMACFCITSHVVQDAREKFGSATDNNPAYRPYGSGAGAMAAGAVAGTSAASTGSGAAALKAGGSCKLDFTFNCDLFLAVLSSFVSFATMFAWNAWPGWLLFPAVLSVIFLLRTYQGSFGETPGSSWYEEVNAAANELLPAGLAEAQVAIARKSDVMWWFPPPDWLVPVWTKRFLMLGHVCFTVFFAGALALTPGWPPLEIPTNKGQTQATGMQVSALSTTWAVFVIFSFLVTCSFGFNIKPQIYVEKMQAENEKMRAFERTAPVQSGTKTLEALAEEAYGSKLAGIWCIFAMAMSVLSACYQFVPEGRVILQIVGRQGWFAARCIPWHGQFLPGGSCLYHGEDNVGSVVFFAVAMPLTAAISFAIQLLQHKYDAFFLVTQTHLQWLTDNMPGAGAQCETTHERLRKWWDLREFYVNDKLPVLYRFASPGFAFILVLDAVLALALVLLDLQTPGIWHSSAQVVALSAHAFFITAFLLKTCWRLYACSSLQASHAIKLQQLKRQQLAKTELIKSAGGEATTAGVQNALLFAEEIEAMVAVIHLGDHTQEILGVAVTPQKLVFVLTYFGSGLVALLRSTST